MVPCAKALALSVVRANCTIPRTFSRTLRGVVWVRSIFSILSELLFHSYEPRCGNLVAKNEKLLFIKGFCSALPMAFACSKFELDKSKETVRGFVPGDANATARNESSPLLPFCRHYFHFWLVALDLGNAIDECAPNDVSLCSCVRTTIYIRQRGSRLACRLNALASLTLDVEVRKIDPAHERAAVVAEHSHWEVSPHRDINDFMG